jgi:hypothetical protein
VNNQKRSSKILSSLVPGAKYRITAWGLGGGRDRRRSRSAAVVEVTTNQQSESTGARVQTNTVHTSRALIFK